MSPVKKSPTTVLKHSAIPIHLFQLRTNHRILYLKAHVALVILKLSAPIPLIIHCLKAGKVILVIGHDLGPINFLPNGAVPIKTSANTSFISTS